MVCNCVVSLLYIYILMIGNAVGISSNSYRFDIFPEASLDFSSQTIGVSSPLSKLLSYNYIYILKSTELMEEMVGLGYSKWSSCQ